MGDASLRLLIFVTGKEQDTGQNPSNLRLTGSLTCLVHRTVTQDLGVTSLPKDYCIELKHSFHKSYALPTRKVIS